MFFQKVNIRLLILVLLSACIVSCTFEKQAQKSVSLQDVNPLRQEIVEDARRAIGAGYRYGATGERKYDCSGLVYALYSSQNISLPRSTREMARMGKEIRKKELRPGDLVFFRNVRKIDHVAIVSRKSPTRTWLIHSTTSRGVVEQVLEDSPYWNTRIDQYRSFIP